VNRAAFLLSIGILLSGLVAFASRNPVREFLTEKEIEAIQENQDIATRTKMYLQAATLRLVSAQARLTGEETEPGAPLEFLTPEDMLDGYYRIIQSVMANLEDAYQIRRPDRDGIKKALKYLRYRMENDLDKLELLEKMAAEREKKEFLDLVRRAVDIAKGADSGAKESLSSKPFSSKDSE
jgi:hypothetical protein